MGRSRQNKSLQQVDNSNNSQGQETHRLEDKLSHELEIHMMTTEGSH
jgi:hypothetical protein